MIGIIGIVVIFVMVFGGYMLAGGKLGIILKSLPFEMIPTVMPFKAIRRGASRPWAASSAINCA